MRDTALNKRVLSFVISHSLIFGQWGASIPRYLPLYEYIITISDIDGRQHSPRRRELIKICTSVKFLQYI